MDAGRAETKTAARSFHGIEVGRVETRTAARSAQGIEAGREATMTEAFSFQGIEAGNATTRGEATPCADNAKDVTGAVEAMGVAGRSLGRGLETAGESPAPLSMPIIRDNQPA
jgi:hypothetical protein